MPAKVLIVDDEQEVVRLLEVILTRIAAKNASHCWLEKTRMSFCSTL